MSELIKNSILLLLQLQGKINNIEPYDPKDYDAFENLLVTVFEQIFPNTVLDMDTVFEKLNDYLTLNS